MKIKNNPVSKKLRCNFLVSFLISAYRTAHVARKTIINHTSVNDTNVINPETFIELVGGTAFDVIVWILDLLSVARTLYGVPHEEVPPF